MTTREIYFKCYFESSQPTGWLLYIAQDEEVYLPRRLYLSYNDPHDDNIQKMLECEKKVGFKFWGNSPEGEDFLKSLKWVASYSLEGDDDTDDTYEDDIDDDDELY